MPKPSATSHITQPQLCKLSGLSPAFFTHHADELPPHIVLPDGTASRPPKAWTLAQIAELILTRTAGWTDLELRLRAALLTPRPAEGEAMSKPLFNEVVTDENGRVLYVPPCVGLTAQQVAADKAARTAARSKSRARPRRAETN